MDGHDAISEEPKHPIRVVTRRTGLSQDVLRAWERRYGAVAPGRSGTRRRLYSDLDIERLRLLKKVVDGGRRISDVATLSLEELQALAAADLAETVEPVVPGVSARDGDRLSTLLAESIDALQNLDRERLDRAFAEAAVSLSNPIIRQGLIAPLLRVVGEQWRKGTIRVTHEHLASAIVRRFLDSMRNGGNPSGPRIVVTTPAGELHELGALMVATAAEESGWNAVYLGPNLPAEDIAAGVREVDAKVVALSVLYAADERRLREELRKLRKYVGRDVRIIVGGRASDGMFKLLDEMDAMQFGDIDAFQQELERIGF